MEQEYSS